MQAKDYQDQMILKWSEKDVIQLEDLQTIALQNCPGIGVKKHYVPLLVQKIEVNGSCWLWTASRKENGYAQYNTGDRNWNAHRLVYLLSGKVITPAMELDHLCRVRHCVNPQHLEAVTHALNVRRAADMVTHCPQGHAYTKENTYLHKGNRMCRMCRAARCTQQTAARRKERA